MTTLAQEIKPVEQIKVVPEPRVISKPGKGETDCKQALLSGPYDARKETHQNKLTLGIIGIYELVDACKQWLVNANDFVESEPTREIETAWSFTRHRRIPRTRLPEFKMP